MVVKKGRHLEGSSGGIRKPSVPNPNLRFSFRLFDATDEELCPASFGEGYVRALMERLKGLSTWTVNEFVSGGGQGMRNHPIDWENTSRPAGFPLPEQYEAYTPFQFAITANQRGRVHGLMIDDTFHVIWLDQDHKLYS